jgi:putative oxidoreductase
VDVVAFIGRILFVVLFLNSAFGHLSQTQALAGYAQSKGVPAAKAATLVAGVVMLIGGLMVILGLWADLGALLLVVFLLPTAVLMHAFWKETDAQARQQEMIHFLKDLALGGAALFMFAVFVKLGDDLGITITGPLFK